VLEEAAVGHGGAALVRGTPSYAGAPPPFALRRRGSPQFGYPSLPPSSDEEGVGGWLIGTPRQHRVDHPAPSLGYAVARRCPSSSEEGRITPLSYASSSSARSAISFSWTCRGIGS